MSVSLLSSLNHFFFLISSSEVIFYGCFLPSSADRQVFPSPDFFSPSPEVALGSPQVALMRRPKDPNGDASQHILSVICDFPCVEKRPHPPFLALYFTFLSLLFFSDSLSVDTPMWLARSQPVPPFSYESCVILMSFRIFSLCFMEVTGPLFYLSVSIVLCSIFCLSLFFLVPCLPTMSVILTGFPPGFIDWVAEPPPPLS